MKQAIVLATLLATGIAFADEPKSAAAAAAAPTPTAAAPAKTKVKHQKKDKKQNGAALFKKSSSKG